MDIDVTDKVRFYNPDDEALPLIQCVCGKRFDSWDCIVSIYRNNPFECDCGAKLYFSQSIKVYQVSND